MADGTNTLPDAFASPIPGTKYALKQVYRDPIARKAYVFFIDANTGSVLNSLDGYTLWEAGLGVGKPDGGTGGTPAPAAPVQENRFADPNTSPIRNDGFDNPQSGFNVDNLYGRRGGEGNNNPVTANPNYQWEVDTFRTPSGPAFANDQTFGRVKSNEGTFLANAPTTLEKSYTAGALSRSLDPNTLSGQSQGFSLPGGMPSAQPTVSGTGGYVGSPSSKGLGDISDDYVMTVAAETAVNDYRGATLVASVMENRAKATNTSVQSIISASTTDPRTGTTYYQFNGYEVRGKYGPGTPQYEMAMKAIMDVRTNGTKTPATYFATPSATNNLLAGTPNASLQKVDTAVNHVFYTDAKNAPIVTAEGTKQVNPEALAPVGNVPGAQQQAQPQPTNPQSFDAKTTPSFTAPTRDQSIGFGISQPAQSTQVANIAPQEGRGLTQVQPSFVNPGSVYGPQPAQTSYNPSDLAALGGTGRIGTATNTAGGRTSYAIESQAQEKNRAYDVATGRASNVPNNVTSGAWTQPGGIISPAVNQSMNPLLDYDSSLASKSVSPDAGKNMQSFISNEYQRMNAAYSAMTGKNLPEINDAIAKQGTTRESQTPGSMHFQGKAFDFNTRGLTNFEKQALMEAGRVVGAQGKVGGLGLGDGIIHFDIGNHRSWSYGNTATAGVPVSDLQEKWASGQSFVSPELAAKAKAAADSWSPSAGQKGFYDQPMSFNAPGYVMPNSVDMVRDTLAAGPMASKSFDGTFATPQSAAEGFAGYNEAEGMKQFSESMFLEADEVKNDMKTGVTTVNGNITIAVPLGENFGAVERFDGKIVYDPRTKELTAIPNKIDDPANKYANDRKAAVINQAYQASIKTGMDRAAAMAQVYSAIAGAAMSGDVKVRSLEEAYREYGIRTPVEGLQKNQAILNESLAAKAAGLGTSFAVSDEEYAKDQQDRASRKGFNPSSVISDEEYAASQAGREARKTASIPVGPVVGPNLARDVNYNFNPQKMDSKYAETMATMADRATRPSELEAKTFGDYTEKGKERTVQKEIQQLSPGVIGYDKNGVPIWEETGLSFGYTPVGAMPAYTPTLNDIGKGFVDMAANAWSSYEKSDTGSSAGRGVSGGRQNAPSFTSGNDYSGYDWSGGYTGRDARDSGRTAEFDSPTEGSRFGLKDGSAVAAQTRTAEANRQAESARAAEAARQASIQAQAAAQQAAQAAAAGQSSGGGYSSQQGGGGSDRRGDSTTGGGSGGRDSSQGNYGGFSGGWSGGYNSGSANQGTGQGVGGVGGNSPSTGSGGTGGQGGPGPAGGSGGFGFGGGSQGGYNGTDGGRR